MPGGTMGPRSTTTRRCPGCGPATVTRYDPVQHPVLALKRSRVISQASSVSSPAAQALAGFSPLRAKALWTRSGCAAASSHVGSAPKGCRPVGMFTGAGWSRGSTLVDMAVPLSHSLLRFVQQRCDQRLPTMGSRNAGDDVGQLEVRD